MPNDTTQTAPALTSSVTPAAQAGKLDTSLTAKLDALYIRACNVRSNSKTLSSDLCSMVQSTELARDTHFADADLTKRAEDLLAVAREAIDACDRAIIAFVDQALGDAEEAMERGIRPYRALGMGGR